MDLVWFVCYACGHRVEFDHEPDWPLLHDECALCRGEIVWEEISDKLKAKFTHWKKKEEEVEL